LTILLTSFAPWLCHHRSNSSDDLLVSIQDNCPKNPEPQIFNTPPLKPKELRETKKIVSTFFMSQSPKWTPKFQPILLEMDMENFNLN
jgi:hypothetical protein